MIDIAQPTVRENIARSLGPVLDIEVTTVTDTDHTNIEAHQGAHGATLSVALNSDQESNQLSVTVTLSDGDPEYGGRVEVTSQEVFNAHPGQTSASTFILEVIEYIVTELHRFESTR